MEEPLPKKPHQSAFSFFTTSAVAVKATGRLCSKPLVLMLLAGAFAIMAAQTGVSDAAEVHGHLRKAAEYLKSNDPNSAVKEFNAVLALDPRNSEAFANLGVIAFVRRDYQNASQYLRKALAVDPSLAKTQALLGICQTRLGNPSARALLERSFPKLKDKTLRTQVGMELVGLYYQQGDPERATTVVQKLVDLNPENVDILYMAQRLYGELADDTLNKLAILAPGSARMQQVIAERLVNAGDLKGATEHYRKALEISPQLPGVPYELAEAVLETSPADPAAQAEAKKDFENIIAVEGDGAKVQCELGRIAFLQSDTESAYAHFKRAFELNPQDSSAQLGLGRVLMTMEKPQEARKFLELAVQSDPLNNEAHYRLALDYKHLHITDQAQKEMHLFQEIKNTKERVRQLYRQMNIQPKSEPEEDAETEH